MKELMADIAECLPILREKFNLVSTNQDEVQVNIISYNCLNVSVHVYDHVH